MSENVLPYSDRNDPDEIRCVERVVVRSFSGKRVGTILVKDGLVGCRNRGPIKDHNGAFLRGRSLSSLGMRHRSRNGFRREERRIPMTDSSADGMKNVTLR